MELSLQLATLRQSYQEKYMMIFLKKKDQIHNDKLCKVRSIFDKFNFNFWITCIHV